MPTQALAKKAVAVQTVMVLHNNGELDDALLPVGKEAVPQEPDLCITAENAEDFGEFRFYKIVFLTPSLTSSF